MIGVLIKTLNKPLFVEKTKRLIIDNKCKHYDSSMSDFKFCPQCGTNLEPKIKEEIYYESEIKDFKNQYSYEFEDEKYSVERDHDTHKFSRKYFISVQHIFNKDHDLKFNAQFYIQRLQIANKIAEKLQKEGFETFAGIINFENHCSEIELDS
jgi:hypothetical protein